jgi:hypothetical protein
VTRRSNVRFGVNYFKYSGSTSKDNITYNGTLRLESAEVLYDQYIGGGFHISPGVMVYDGNQGTANASVSAGQTFSLNGVTYYSSNASPVTGTGTITSRAPHRVRQPAPSQRAPFHAQFRSWRSLPGLRQRQVESERQYVPQ